MVFETERLVIRPWTHSTSDVDRIFDIYSRWEVARWLGATPQVMDSRDQAERAVDRWADRTDEHGHLGVWAVQVRDTGIVGGTVMLVPLPPSAAADHAGEPVEVAWHFHPNSWGNGYATEAARATLDRGFKGGLTEIFALVRPDNEPSIGVCRRLGMTALGRTSRWYDTELEAFRARQRRAGGGGAGGDEPGNDLGRG